MVEIGAQIVETLRGKRKNLCRFHIGSVHHNERRARPTQIGETRAVKQLAVEEIAQRVDAGVAAQRQPRQSQRVRCFPFERLHIVAFEKIGLQLVETGRADKAEPRGDDAAARDRRDDLDAFDQRHRAPARWVAVGGELVEYPEPEGGRPRPAPRERDQDQRRVRVGSDQVGRRRVGGACGERPVGIVGDRVASGGEDRQQGEEGACDYRAH